MSAWTSLPQRAGDLHRRWFPERQIILRQHDSVKAIRLAPGIQLLAACAFLIGALWTAGATGAYLSSLIAVADVRWENDQLRIGYRMVTRLKEDAASADIRARELERQVGEARLEWQATLAARDRRISAAQAESQAAQAARDALAARLAESEQRMRVTTAKRDEAVSRLTDETRRSISEVERIVGAARLDLKRLVPPRADGRRQNSGGPFVPWSIQPGDQPRAAPQAATPDIVRLDELLRLLRSMPLSAPLHDFSLTSPFGYRIDPFNGEAAIHEGIDLQAPFRTPVRAAAPGRVIFAGRHQSYGNMVEIEHGFNIRTRYAHLDRISVAQGDKITLQQQIGLLGESGRASGPHLHYEVLVNGHPNDPLNFLKAASDVRKKP
jgi:murein DD-endopeptidase MepM/ murein hydrolase activator NlpD